MYDPFGDRQARRAQRRYERDMRRYYRYQNPMRGLAGAFVLIALIIAFALGGSFFMPLLFVGLAFASLFGLISMSSRTSIYGGFYSFIWLLGLALCFIIGFWPWILLPIVVSMILGALFRPIMGGLAGASFLAGAQPQQSYQHQPQPGYESYQQGYQGAPAQPHEAYREGSQQYESQTPYPAQQQQQQELPPMEQH